MPMVTFSENSEYEEAKNEQAFVEGRILEIEKMIKNAQVIDREKGTFRQTIQIETTISFNFSKKKEKANLHCWFYGPDPTEISYFKRLSRRTSTPGKKKGEKVSVQAPSGTFEYEIIELH